MISEQRVEMAVEFLRDTARDYGKARGHLAFCDANLRRVKALEMIGKDGSLGDREALAYASEAYKAAIEALENATADSETLRARRDAAEFTIEVWRSQFSAAKRGNI
jgi:hypothetical protein